MKSIPLSALCSLVLCFAFAVDAAHAQNLGNPESGSVSGQADVSGPGRVNLGGPPTGNAPPPSRFPAFDPLVDPGLAPVVGTPVRAPFGPTIYIDGRFGEQIGSPEDLFSFQLMLPRHVTPGETLFATWLSGSASDDGDGLLNLGTGYRRWVPSIDRIFTLGVWGDLDDTHEETYYRLGVSGESLGRFFDARFNTYFVFNDDPEQLSNVVFSQKFFRGNNLIQTRETVTERAYSGADLEIGGLLPGLGRYGVSGYIGAYYLRHDSDNDDLGFMARIETQVTDDVTVNVTHNNGDDFGQNTFVNVMLQLPDGRPRTWFRPKRVRQRLNAPIVRDRTVHARLDVQRFEEPILNPATGAPFMFAFIDPNAGGGNGTFDSQFGSIPEFQAANNPAFEIVLVRPRTDGTNTNLDAAGSIQLLTGQRFLASNKQAFVNGNCALPTFGTIGGPGPLVTNTSGAGGSVITLADNTEVSGFTIDGTDGMGNVINNGIVGTNVTGFDVNCNVIINTINGVAITTNAGGTSQGVVRQNTISDSTQAGVLLTADSGMSTITVGGAAGQGNMFSGNADAAVASDLSGTAMAAFDVSNNTIIGQNTGITFFIDGDTFTQPFSIINNSAALDVTQIVFDIASSVAGAIYNTETGAFVPFTPVLGSEVLTGLQTVNGTAVPPFPNNLVPDFSTLIDLVFNDFNPGEAIVYNIDADLTPGGDESVFGDQLIGSTLTATFSNGNTIMGALVAVPGNPDASIFTQLNAAPTGEGIRINATDMAQVKPSTFNNNTITDVSGNAIAFNGSGTANFMNAVVRGNMITTPMGNGISTNLAGGSMGVFNIGGPAAANGNMIDAAGNNGIRSVGTGTSMTTLVVQNNTVTNSAGPGLFINGQDTAKIDALIGGPTMNLGNIFTANTDANVLVQMQDNSFLRTLVIQNNLISGAVDDPATNATADPMGDGVLLLRQDSSLFGAVGGAGPFAGLGDIVVGNNTILGQTGAGNMFINNAGTGLRLVGTGSGNVTNTLLYDGNLFQGNLNGFQAQLFGNSIFQVVNDMNLYNSNLDHGVQVTTNDQSVFGTAANRSMFLGDTFMNQDADTDGVGDNFNFVVNGTPIPGSPVISGSSQNVLIGAAADGTRTSITGGQNGVSISNSASLNGGNIPSVYNIQSTDMNMVTVDGVNLVQTGSAGTMLTVGGPMAAQFVRIASSGDDGFQATLANSFNNLITIQGDATQPLAMQTTITGSGRLTGNASTDANNDTIVDDDSRGDGISIVELGGVTTTTVLGTRSVNNVGRGLDVDSRSEFGTNTYQIGDTIGNGTPTAVNNNTFSNNGLQGAVFFTTAQNNNNSFLADRTRVVPDGDNTQEPPGALSQNAANPGRYQDVATPLLLVDTDIVFEGNFVQSNGTSGGPSADGAVFSVGTNTQMDLLLTTTNPLTPLGTGGNEGDDIVFMTHVSLEMNNFGLEANNAATNTIDIVGLDAIGQLNVIFGIVDTNGNRSPDSRVDNNGVDRGNRGETFRVQTMGANGPIAGSVLDGFFNVGSTVNNDNGNPFRAANRPNFSIFNVFVEGGSGTPATNLASSVLDGMPPNGPGNIFFNMGVLQDVDGTFSGANNVIDTDGVGATNSNTIIFNPIAFPDPDFNVE